MSEPEMLSCYLAGPIANCNAKQKHEWRDALKRKLGDLNWTCSDPTELDPWTPHTEFQMIEACHVVVANLWKESIGTIAGIMQARRLGKRVVLYLPTRIESTILETIVGDPPVYEMPDVVFRLQSWRAWLTTPITVRKGLAHVNAEEPFSADKVIQSVTQVCRRVRMNDDWLPASAARHVEEYIRAQRSDSVTTEVIKEQVLLHLNSIADSDEGIYSEDVKHKARLAAYEWAQGESAKSRGRWADLDKLNIEELKVKIEELEELNDQSDREIRRLRFEIEKARVPVVLSIQAASECDRRWRSIADVVACARAEFDDVLDFSDQLDGAVEDCPYSNYQKVFEAIQGLASYSRRNANGQASIGLREWWDANMSMEYAPKESQGVKTKAWLMQERSVTFAGIKYELCEHLKLGSGDANYCCRIYFKNQTRETGKVLLGLIIPHPSTS